MAKALNVSLAVTADTSQARAALQQLQSTLTQLTTTPTNLTLGGTIKKDAVEATQAIAALQTTLKNATNMQTGNLDLTKFTQQMQASGMSLQKYQNALSSMGTTGKQAFAQLASSIAQAEVPLRRSNTLLSEFWTTMKNTARWQISSSLLHGFIGTIQSAYHYAQDLNESLNNIQIVTGLSNDKMAQFAESANRAAKSLSTTTTSYTDAALIYYQQGIRDDSEIAERVETTIKLANVSGQSAQKVSDQMTAIWNNFADGSHNLEYYADVITALGAATASSSEEIATGLEKFAAVADTVGLSYENASAALATITATTRQSADTVGTGLRTLFSRLQSLKLGDTLEDGVDLTKYTKALETVGVSALDANGNLRAMDNILEDLGARWQTLSDAQKTALAQTVGGVRQYTTLIALMDNFDFYKENQQIALGSEGTVSKQQEIYAQSWEAAAKRVKASAQSIYADLLDDKFFIGLNNTFSGFLDLVHNTITSLGGLKGVLLAIGSVITTVFADKAAQSLSNFVFDVQMLTKGGVERVQQQQKIANDLLINQLSQGATDTDKGLISAYKSQGELSGAYLANASKMNDFQKSIANSYLQQQQALIKNIELQEQQITQSEKAAQQEERRTKGQIYTANGGAQQATSKTQITALEDLKKNYESIGKIEGTLKVMPTIDTNNIKEANSLLTSLGVTVNDFSIYGPQAETAFKNLTSALASGDVDKANASLAELEAICNGIPSAVNTAKDDLVNMYREAVAGSADADEKVKQFEASLEKTLGTVQKTSSGMIEFKGSVQALGTYTDQVKQKMQELAQANFTAAQGFVAMASMISTFAMALTSVKGLISTWKDDQKDLTDKLLATATTLGIVTTMMSRAFSVDTIAKVATLGAKITSAITGTSVSFVGLGASAAAATGPTIGLAGALWAVVWPLLAIAAAVGVFVAIAQAIETPAEKAKRLEQNLTNAQEASQNAKTALQDLGATFDTYDEAIAKTEELTAGTAEYATELQKANDAARELITTYGLTPDQWHFENGKMVINDGVREQLEEKAQAEVTRTTLDVATAKMRQAYNNGTYGMQQIARGQNLMNNASDAFLLGLPAIIATGGLAGLIPVGASAYGNEMREKGAQYYGFADYAAYQQAQADNPEYFKQAMIERNGQFSSAYKDYIGTLLSSDNQLVKEYGEDAIEALADAYGQFAFEKIGSNVDEIEAEVNGIKSTWLQGSIGSFSPLGDKAISDIKELFYQNGLGAGLEEYLQSDDWKALSQKGDMTNMIDALKEQYVQQKLLSQSTELATADLKKYGDQFSKSRQYTTMSAADREAFMEELEALDQAEPVVQYLMNTVNDMLTSGLMGLAESIGKNTNGTISEEQAQGLNKNLSLEEMSNFGNILTSMNQAFGADSATAIRDKLVEQINSGNKELFNALSNVDMSGDAISILGDMKRTASNALTSSSVRDTFNDFIATAVEELGSEGIFEQLFQSENFADSLESLQKTYKKTGKIGADAILDIANESEYLSDALDLAKFNAAGLADILEAMEMGDLGIDDVTDQLLEAMSAAGELEQNLAEAFDIIDNWEPDRSVMDIGETVADWAQKAVDSIEAGFYGDPQATSVIEKMFGTDALNKYLDSWIYATGDQNWTPEQIDKYMNGANRDMYDALNKVIKWNDLSGMYEYYEKQSSALDALWDMGPNDQVLTNTSEVLKQGLTSQSAYIDYLTKNGVTADMAKLMASQIAYTDGKLYDTWQTTAANNGLDILTGKEGGVTTGKELKAFYDEYGRYLKDANGEAYKNFDDFVASMRETAHSQIVALSEDFDYANASLQDLKDEMVRSGSGELEDYLTAITGKTAEEKRSVEELTSAYEKLGFTAEQALDLIDEEWTGSKTGTGKAEDFAEYFGIDRISEVGKDQWNRFMDYLSSNGISADSISAADWADFLNFDSAQQAVQQQAEIFAKAFTDAFANLDINIDDNGHVTITPKVDEEAAAEAGEAAGKAASDAAQEATEPVEVTAEYKPMSDLEALASSTLQMFADMKEAATWIGEKLEGLGKKAEQGISDWWSGIEQDIADFDTKIQSWKQAAQEKATQWWSDFQADLDTLNTTIEGWKNTAVEAATQWWSDMQSELAELSTTVNGWKEAAIEKVTSWWSEVQAGIDGIDAKVSGWKEAAVAEITEWWSDVQSGIAELSATVDGWKATAIEKVTSWWTDVQTGVSELSTTIDGWKATVVEAAISWWADIQSGVAELTTTITGWKDSIVEGITGWWNGIVEGITSIGSTIGQWVSDIWPFGKGDGESGGWSDSNWNPKNWFGGRDNGTGETDSELLGEIAHNTDVVADKATEPEQRVATTDGKSSVTTQNTTNVTNTTTTTTTNVNQQVAQNTGNSESTVALVSALRQAGVTADTYQQGQTIDQIDWSGLSVELSNTLATALKNTNNGETLTNEQFATISAEIDSLTVGAEVEPIEVPAEVTEVDDTALQNEDESKIETTAEVTEVDTSAIDEAAAEPIEAEATVNYTLGDQEEPEPKDTKVNYRMGEQANPTPRWTSVNYSLGSQANPVDKTAKVNYVRGTQEGPSDQTATASCFVAGTQILMADYTTKNIEDVQTNEFVIGYNEITGKFEAHKVTKTFIHYDINKTYKIYFNNGEILHLTPEHPILSINGWKTLYGGDIQLTKTVSIPTTSLAVGDQIVGYNNIILTIDLIELINDDINRTVYNLEVDICHTYLANNIVVHNRKVAMGYNNVAFAAGYTGANHSSGSYQGLATLGELGPELMIHGNQAYLVGLHGRVTTYVQPDDQIFTAAQTQKILATNPLMRDIPGFSAGFNHDQTTTGGGSGGSGGGSGGSDKSSTKEIKETLWYPERYHLIERQIDDLTRAYEKLNKAKDRAYGANRLKAINDEIKAHKELMKAQQKEIDEAKGWLEYDKAQLQQAGLWGEMQFDENGNIANFDELQNKYSRAIKQGLGIVGEVDEATYEANEDAKEEAQKKWDLITHYEETLDKLKDLDDDYLDSLYELADMLQELATTKVEIRVNVDQKDLDLLEHYINKIDDNVWATGDVLSLVGGKLANYADQINVYKNGMNDLLKNATNAQGQAVPGLNLATWMAMSPEQRDALNLDSNLMEKIEEYEEEILKLLDNIEQLKTKGLEELAAAFDEVNTATQTSLAMFDNYSDTISRLKDMTEVQMAFKPTSDTNKLLDRMDRAAIRQNKDQLKARQAYTAELEKERAIIQELYDKEIDTDRKKLYQEQLDNFDSLILTEQQKIEDLWKNSADAIKNIYDRLIDDITDAFDKAINAHGYDSEDLYTEGKNTRQMQQDEVVDDYERLYRLTNLQRKVDKDIDDRLKANLKNNQRLIALQEEINNLKETGQEMSEYELELLEKKYEYELAMAELEDDAAAKSTVRLTRDRNGNWGYVFSAAPDENAEYEKQQAASDALYERQKLDQTRLNEVASQIDELGQRYSSEIQNLEQAVINGEITAAEAVAQRAQLQAEYQKQLATLMRDLNVAMEDSAITQPLMVERYGDQNATIRDSFNETSNAIVNEARTIQDYFTSTNEAFDDFLTHYQQAIDDYNEEMEQLNSDVSQGTEDFEYLAEQQLKALQKASAEQLQQVRDNIAEMQKVIGEGDETILAEVERFNRLYSQKFQPVIDTNERFLNQLQEILSLLNRIDYDVDNQNTITSQEKLIADQQAKLDQGRTASQKDSGQIAGYDEGGYTGMWGNWGKLAILHEGEQVFNKADTNKLLDAAKILRTLDLQADFFGKGLSFLSEMPKVNENSESSFQQEVHINANFPGVSSRAEIVAAFSDLENQAYQYANRKYTAIKNTA